MKTVRRLKAVSPVIATLLLIAIAVATAIILYVFVAGYVGSLTSTGGQQTVERLQMDAYNYRTNTLSLTLRNVGGTAVQIDQIYFGGTIVNTHAGSTCFSTVPLDVQQTCIINMTPTPVPPAGTSHTFKVITRSGGVFTFTVVKGQAQ
jgi:flagellin-like protein